MSKLFERFRKKKDSHELERASRLVDQRLIGSKEFDGRPVSAREYLMPLRQRIQAQYKSEGRDPDSLSKIPAHERDEQFWLTYIDSLMVFERDEEALIYATDARSRFPLNNRFREIITLVKARME